MRKSLLVFLFLTLAVLLMLRRGHITLTPIMMKRSLSSGHGFFCRQQAWMPLEQISSDLVNAILAAEDQRFFSHHGFDLKELRLVWKRYRSDGAPLRGCSTISQQTAKNMFTFGTQTFLRKMVEAFWTVMIELIWGKQRILEVYLNVVEMGPGIYGVEAASQYYYGIPACQVDAKRAASLAVCLPRPLVLRPDNLDVPSRKAQRQIIAYCLDCE